MLIANTTFMMLHEREPEFLDWFRMQLPIITDARWGGVNPRLSAMRQAGGIDHTQAEAQSVAFQMEFGRREDLDRWNKAPLANVAADFEEKFGPEAMVFSSIFEILPL